MNRCMKLSLLFLTCVTFTRSQASTPLTPDGKQSNYFACVFTDLNGCLRSIIRPSAYLSDTLKRGIDFDGSSIPGYSHIAESDMHLSPDVEHIYTVTDSLDGYKTSYIFSDVYTDDVTPYDADSRVILKQAITQAEQLGYQMKVGAELEFFILNRDGTPYDDDSYCNASNSPTTQTMLLTLLAYLEKSGIAIEKLHHEVAPGQYEIVLHHADPLTLSDQVILCRHLIKTFVQTYDLVASFTPKPFDDQNGSALHIHFSLTDLSGTTCFYDETQQAYLSKTAQSFIAGVLAHIKSFTAILNPTSNSYKRLQPGYEAPVALCWAAHNRSALIRIPRIAAGNANAARAEIRSPDSSCNPYLTCAALLKSGIKGIIDELEIPEPITDNAYISTNEEIDHLPQSLHEACTLLERDSTTTLLFNELFVQTYCVIKKKELEKDAKK